MATTTVEVWAGTVEFEGPNLNAGDSGLTRIKIVSSEGLEPVRAENLDNGIVFWVRGEAEGEALLRALQGVLAAAFP